MIDLQRIEQLAQTTFDFVREQTKPLVSQLSLAANGIFKHFFGLTGQNTTSVTSLFENSESGRPTKTPLALSSTANLETLKKRLVDQSEALLDNQGLVIDEDHFQLLEDTWQAKNASNNNEFEDNIVVNGIGKSGNGLHYMSITIKNPETNQPQDVMVPVKVLKSASGYEEVASALIELLPEGGKPSNPVLLCGEVNASHITELMASQSQFVPTPAPETPEREITSQHQVWQSTAHPPVLVHAAPTRPVLASKTFIVSASSFDKNKLPPDWAFVDKQKASNLCGVAAINGFFQAPVIAAGDAVKEIINTYLNPELVNEHDVPHLPGLFHPKVVKAMREGKAATISRQEFSRKADVELNDLMYPVLTDEELLNDYGVEELAPLSEKNQARVAAQWRSFFNYTHTGADDLAELIESSPMATIHPETWITTFTGLGLEHLMNITNAQLLKLEKSNADWRAYPKKVDCLRLSRLEEQRTHELEWLSMAVEEIGVNHLICMGGDGMTGHYFALVKDTAGNWLKLDGLGPEEKSGVHKVADGQQATPKTLAKKLKDWNVTQVIADGKLVEEFQEYNKSLLQS